MLDQIESIPSPLRPFNPIIQALAHEGVEISNNLCQWHQDYLERSLPETAYTRLAQIDLHALILFLCHTYSYYECWGSLTIPSLTRSCVEDHVKAIIGLAESIQTASHVPGVLLLFALRVAGGHATNTMLMQMVIQRLDVVYWEGFIVSERIKSDLQEFWEYRRSLDGSQIYC